MNANSRRLAIARALLYTLGQLDAAKGVKPQRTSRAYLAGYGQQYAAEAMASSQIEAAF